MEDMWCHSFSISRQEAKQMFLIWIRGKHSIDNPDTPKVDTPHAHWHLLGYTMEGDNNKSFGTCQALTQRPIPMGKKRKKSCPLWTVLAGLVVQEDFVTVWGGGRCVRDQMGLQPPSLAGNWVRIATRKETEMGRVGWRLGKIWRPPA